MSIFIGNSHPTGNGGLRKLDEHFSTRKRRDLDKESPVEVELPVDLGQGLIGPQSPVYKIIDRNGALARLLYLEIPGEIALRKRNGFRLRDPLYSCKARWRTKIGLLRI